MSNEIKQIYTSGFNLYATRRNGSGQVALTDGSGFETYGASGHDADDYDVALTDKSGALYLGDFDNSGNISTNQSGQEERYTIEVFRRVGANPADTDPVIGGEEIRWDKSTGEILAPTPDEIATAIINKTGITAGGTFTFGTIQKLLAAWAAGKWQDKSGSPGTYEVLDPDDGVTVVMEVTPGQTSPQKAVSIS